MLVILYLLLYLLVVKKTYMLRIHYHDH